MRLGNEKNKKDKVQKYVSIFENSQIQIYLKKYWKTQLITKIHYHNWAIETGNYP